MSIVYLVYTYRILLCPSLQYSYRTLLQYLEHDAGHGGEVDARVRRHLSRNGETRGVDER